MKLIANIRKQPQILLFVGIAALYLSFPKELALLSSDYPFAPSWYGISLLIANSFLEHLFAAIAGAGTLFFLFGILRYFFSAYSQVFSQFPKRIIYIATYVSVITYAFLPSVWQSVTEANGYVYFAFFALGFVWALTQWRLNNKTYWLYVAASIFSFSFGFFKETMFLLPIGVYFIAIPLIWNSFRAKLVVIAASIIAIPLLYWVQYTFVLYLASSADVLLSKFVSTPVYVGFYLFFILVGFTLYLLSKRLRNKGKNHLSQLFVCGMYALIGFVFSLSITIGASLFTQTNANVQQAVGLRNYMLQNQIDAPLLYGKTYAAPEQGLKPYRTQYTLDNGKYSNKYYEQQKVYANEFTVLFPRMWSNTSKDIEAYKLWAGISDNINTHPMYVNGRTYHQPMPAENFSFFVSYQLMHSYVRYILWNFVGKQNDVIGKGEPMYGNWISGIVLLDNLRLGAQNLLPDASKNNGRIPLFFIPLLFAVIGFWWLLRNARSILGYVLFLFLLTGVFVVLYINIPPLLAAEIDSRFLVSYACLSAFAGFSVFALYSLANKYLSKGRLLYVVVVIGCLPLLLLGNAVALDSSSKELDMVSSQLQNCKQGSVVIVPNTKDSYMFEYAQRSANVRTDIQVINFEHLQNDWYIENIRKQIPLQLTPRAYAGNNNDSIPVLLRSPIAHLPYPAQDIFAFINSTKPEHKIRTSLGALLDFIQVPILVMPVQSQQLVSNKIVCDTTGFIPYVPIQLVSPKQYPDTAISKRELAFLDIMYSLQWKKPLYLFPTIKTQFNSSIQKLSKPSAGLDIVQPTKNWNIECETLRSIEVQIGKSKTTSTLQDFHIQYVLRYAYDQIQANNTTKALSALRICKDWYGAHKGKNDTWKLQLAHAYFLLGQNNIAIQLYKQIIDYIETSFLYYNTLPESAKTLATPHVIKTLDIAWGLYIMNSGSQNHISSIIARSSSIFIQQYFPFVKQITVCAPEAFALENEWILDLSTQSQTVGYWYNLFADYMQNNQE